MSIGSGVYLGDGWVLSPLHVYQYDHHSTSDPRSHIELDREYYEIPGTARAVEHGPGVLTDLMMFRINGNPDLDFIPIRQSDPFGETATIVATGRSRVGDVTTWSGGHTGFATEESRVKRWGRNLVFGYPAARYSTIHVPWDPDPVRTVTESFLTYFDANGLPEEAQPVNRDSGGGVFARNPQDQWELAGVALAVKLAGSYSGPDPLVNAVYGNGAHYADLSRYRSQIEAIRRTPLPGDADLDGDVDVLDINILQAAFGRDDADSRADFNDDGAVDLRDFVIARGNFGMESGNGVPPAGSAIFEVPSTVPEPGTIVLLTAAIPLLLRSRRTAPATHRKRRTA